MTIGGVEYDLPRMKWKKLRELGPLIDQAQALGAGATGVEALGDATSILFQIFAERIGRADVTADFLEDAAEIEEVMVFSDAFLALLQESGLKVGETKPAEAPADEKASEINSTTSSAMSSPVSEQRIGI